MHTIRNLAAFATVFAVTLAGCSGDTITDAPDNSLQPRSLSASASVDRPWKGKCDVDAVFTSATTLLITGTCQLAHLGRSSVVLIQTIGAPDPTTGVIAFTNTGTYTAANGDQLFTTTVGVAIPNASGTGLILSGVETAVGGTGRFEGASGTATLTGEVFFTGPSSTTGSYSLSGRLEY